MNDQANMPVVTTAIEITAGGRPQALVPQSLEQAWRVATVITKSGMAPKEFDTPEKALVAIMQGLEIGMSPLQSMQRIAVVNGRPMIWGDAAIGLVRASGLASYVKETLEGPDDDLIAVCETTRKGEKVPVYGRFSIKDARAAGLWGRNGPWKQYPKRMLQMRARAFCLRDAYADVLGGLYIKEEFDGTPEIQQAPIVVPSPDEVAITDDPLKVPAPQTGPVPEVDIPACLDQRKKKGPDQATVEDAVIDETPDPPATTKHDELLDELASKLSPGMPYDEVGELQDEYEPMLDGAPDAIFAKFNSIIAEAKQNAGF